jgi:Na+/melibiose symporter-like transporter
MKIQLWHISTICIIILLVLIVWLVGNQPKEVPFWFSCSFFAVLGTGIFCTIFFSLVAVATGRD